MFEISLDGVKKFMDATLVLKNITFLVTEGEKVGIVGENGSGKTTILKLIAGIETLHHVAGYPYAPTPLGYDEGWVNTPKNANCAYLEQIPQYADKIKVIDVLNMAFDEVHKIESEMHQLEESMQNSEGTELKKLLTKYSELVELYELKGGYETEEKIRRVSKGLHFDEKFLNQEFNLLSGGEKTTVILGKLLIDKPDILLLDEPTNHLDMDSVEWLEDYLKNYKGIVIVVSHDRYFLDHVVTKIIEIEDKESETYKGDYSDYVRQKEENLRIQYDNYKEQNKKINAMEQSVKELREWALQADNKKFFKRAASIQIKLEKMERIDKPVFEKQNMKLKFTAAERSGNIVIKAEGLSKSFEKKVILTDADLLVHYGERVALIGPNGCGKTTFLKMLLGEEQADSGTVSLGANVLRAYLPQNIVFDNEELTVLDYFRWDISILEGKAREYLSRFMFYGGNVYKKIKHLSGGERIRLKLSKLLYEDINLLILDEPTNHLDTSSIETIEEALSDFKGTIFFISHDRYFINKICNRVIEMEENKFKSYLGNYDEYKEEKEKQNLINMDKTMVNQAQINKKQSDNYKKAGCAEKIQRSEKPKQKDEKNQKEKTQNEKTQKEKTQNEKKLTEKILAEAAKAESRVKSIEHDINEIELTMSTMESDYAELNRLYLKKGDLVKELDMAMEVWLSLND